MTKKIQFILFFLYLVKCKSFKLAAHEFGISVAAASRWIKSLEEEFGVALILRNTRNLSVTEAGELLFTEFTKIKIEMDSVFDDVSAFSHKDKGKIKIASTPMFANNYLKHIISTYFSGKESIDVVLNITPFDVDLFDYDFSIKAEAFNSSVEQHDCDLVRKTLISSRLRLCASQEYIEKNPKIEYPFQLSEHKCLYSKSLTKGGANWIVKDNDNISYHKIPTSLECDSAELLTYFTLQGLGVAFLPELLISEHLKNGELVEVLGDYTEDTYFNFNLYYRYSKFKTNRVNNLLKLVLSETRGGV